MIINGESMYHFAHGPRQKGNRVQSTHAGGPCSVAKLRQQVSVRKSDFSAVQNSTSLNKEIVKLLNPGGDCETFDKMLKS